jgi:hypothetical protein
MKYNFMLGNKEMDEEKAPIDIDIDPADRPDGEWTTGPGIQIATHKALAALSKVNSVEAEAPTKEDALRQLMANPLSRPGGVMTQSALNAMQDVAHKDLEGDGAGLSEKQFEAFLEARAESFNNNENGGYVITDEKVSKALQEMFANQEPSDVSKEPAFRCDPVKIPHYESPYLNKEPVFEDEDINKEVDEAIKKAEPSIREAIMNNNNVPYDARVHALKDLGFDVDGLENPSEPKSYILGDVIDPDPDDDPELDDEEEEDEQPVCFPGDFDDFKDGLKTSIGSHYPYLYWDKEYNCWSFDSDPDDTGYLGEEVNSTALVIGDDDFTDEQIKGFYEHVKDSESRLIYIDFFGTLSNI